MEGRRSRVEIISDLLSLMQRKGGKVKPTHLLYGGNLSYDRLKTYIAELEDAKLIEKIAEKNRVFYKLTDKGYQFITELRRISEVTEAFGL